MILKEKHVRHVDWGENFSAIEALRSKSNALYGEGNPTCTYFLHRCFLLLRPWIYPVVSSSPQADLLCYVL
jgi:hypothetical protein